MKPTEFPQHNKLHILTFPRKRVRKGTVPPAAPTPSPKAPPSTPKTATSTTPRRSHDDGGGLPPFVTKMRKLGSLSSGLEHLDRMSREMAYYLQEIEDHLRRKR